MVESNPKLSTALPIFVKDVIRRLREKGPQNIHSLAAYLDKSPDHVKELALQLPPQSRLQYDDRREDISFIPLSEEIRNKAGLLEYLKKQPDGVVEDDELLDSYFGLKDDLQKLEKERNIRFLAGKEKKKLIFARIDEVDFGHDLEKLCPKEVKDMWDKLSRGDVERRENSRE